MIDPNYYQAWFTVIDQAKNKHGWPIPVYIEQYLSAVLANYVDKPDWQPQPSWAETLLQIQTAQAAKVLGDQALFAAAVFPTMLTRKGIPEQYFHNIGRASYNRAININAELFGTMSQHFSYIAHCLQQCVRDNPHIEWHKQ
jgi:hypothetical protein